MKWSFKSQISCYKKFFFQWYIWIWFCHHTHTLQSFEATIFNENIGQKQNMEIHIHLHKYLKLYTGMQHVCKVTTDLDMEQMSPILTWWEFPMIQSVRYSTSLFRNFISCRKVRSSRRNIIASTSWQSLILIWMAWTVESRCLTYLKNKASSELWNPGVSRTWKIKHPVNCGIQVSQVPENQSTQWTVESRCLTYL